MTVNSPETPRNLSLGDQLEHAILNLPGDNLTFSEIVDRFGAQGLLLMCALLTLVFLIPVSIPGVSTVFGAAILLVGVSRVFDKPVWLPARVRTHSVSTAQLRPALLRGLVWVRRLEKVSRSHRMSLLVEGRLTNLLNNLLFVFAALLLMAPFGLIPFSNTLPGLALLFYSIGLVQRDGIVLLLGHLATLLTVVYFGLLIGGGGLAIKQMFQYLAG